MSTNQPANAGNLPAMFQKSLHDHWRGLPGTLARALGLLVGIDLVFGGFSLIARALSARQENT